MAAGGRNAPTTRSGGFLEDPELQWSITKRFDTFSDFREGRVGNMAVSAVADNGFAFDRTRKVIRCVWCGATVTEWENFDSVSIIQQLHNNNCPKGHPVEEPPTTEEPSSIVAEDQVEGRTYNAEIDLSTRGTDSGPIHVLRRDNERMVEERKCKKCNRSQVETLFLPCRHLVACEVCADEVEDCFVCDTKILGTVRVYMM